MPNKENLREWVKALRSGEYEQTTGALRRGDGYCCLGVACDISGLGEWRDKPDMAESFYVIGDRPGESATLPRDVREWLGVESANPNLLDEHGNRHISAAFLNDTKGYTFDQLADAIERTYELAEV